MFEQCAQTSTPTGNWSYNYLCGHSTSCRFLQKSSSRAKSRMKTSAQTLIKELDTVAVVLDKDSERETSFQREAERDLQGRR
jgi:hypothetical protein